MQFTPSQAAAHLKESIASYIESQYRISHPLVFAERSAGRGQSSTTCSPKGTEAGCEMLNGEGGDQEDT